MLVTTQTSHQVAADTAIVSRAGAAADGRGWQDDPPEPGDDRAGGDQDRTEADRVPAQPDPAGG